MLVIAMLVGCGPTWDGFRERAIEATCEQQMACAGDYYGTIDACRATFEEVYPVDEPDTFDAQAAADCLDVMEDWDPECSADYDIGRARTCEVVW